MGSRSPKAGCRRRTSSALTTGSERTPTEASHLGTKRFAQKWGLRLVEDQLHTGNIYRVLALRQGARTEDADRRAQTTLPVPWSGPAMRHVWNDQKDLTAARNDAEREVAVENVYAREVLEVLALRQGGRAVAELRRQLSYKQARFGGILLLATCW